MRHRRSSAVSKRAQERGFILVTAVMFVLILTVLGASLLSHGPLEDSLVADRINSQQAFFYAEAGLARGALVLRGAGGQPVNLSDVNSLRPASASAQNVPLIRAIQQHPASGGSDSTGPVILAGGDAGPITLMATGQAVSGSGFGKEVRTLSQAFKIISNQAQDFENLATSTTGNMDWKKNGTFIGMFRVPTSADSANLVASGFPPDSIYVGGIDPPNYTSYITKMISGPSGFNGLTSNQIANSTTSKPLVLGKNTNGIYYAASDLNVPGGGVGSLKIYGTVFLLVHGQASVSKDLNIVAGNSSAALILVTDVPSGQGIYFNKAPNNNGVPTIMLTDGNVYFKMAGTLVNTSIFGGDFNLAMGQTWSYNHAVMDPLIEGLIAQGLMPSGNNGNASLKPLSGQWAELAQPRLP